MNTVDIKEKVANDNNFDSFEKLKNYLVGLSSEREFLEKVINESINLALSSSSTAKDDEKYLQGHLQGMIDAKKLHNYRILEDEQSKKELTENDKKLFEYLLGEGAIDGKWFGDTHEGMFWWREQLRGLYRDLSRGKGGAQKVEWIDFQEQSPPDYENVLILLSNGEIFNSSVCDDVGGYVIKSPYFKLNKGTKITHWMPLPETPLK